MFNDSTASARALGDRVRGASRHGGPWPRISVWHGAADPIVKPSNGESIIAQWLNVHGLPEQPSGEEWVDGHIRRVWNGKNGMPQLEAFSIAGMGHGVPVGTTGEDICGAAGPFFLDAGISAAHQIVRFWRLDDTQPIERVSGPKIAARHAVLPAGYETEPAAHAAQPAAGTRPAPSPFRPDAVIAAAFKAAGLPPLASQPDGSRRTDPDSIIAAALKAAGLAR
jgi:hypothetical protein